jgi:DNA-binding transcriptional regulator LsrR (DeoR family)
VHQVEDWAEVHRLFYREGMAKAAIARRLGMSRNTVDRLLALREPPRYVRVAMGSHLDLFVERIAAMLATDPTVRATVIRRAPATGRRPGRDHDPERPPRDLATYDRLWEVGA